MKPKVVMKTKGTASYKGKFQTVEEARASDKVICLIPSSDGRFYELRKTEQGEFIAPKNKVVDFQQVRAGFIPALPLIPLSLISSITAFFRAFMQENEEYEALALIYWDKVERRFFSYVPKQTVSQEHIDADLRDCPYDDNTRYIRYVGLEAVLDGLRLRLGLVYQRLELAKLPDLALDLVHAHCVFSFPVLGGQLPTTPRRAFRLVAVQLSSGGLRCR